MATRSVHRVRDAALTRLLLLLHRYTLESTELASTALGLPAASNLEIQLLITIAATPAATSGDLAKATEARPKDVSTTLGELERHGLITRDRDPDDRRVVRVTATRRGRRALATFSTALVGFFHDTAPTAKEVLLLLDHPEPAPDTSGDTLQAARSLAIAGRRASAAIMRSGLPSGVTSPRARYALALLSQDGDMRPTHLAGQLRLSRSATTGLIDDLQSQGLVARRRDADPHDRRAVHVTLTARGHRAVQQMSRALDPHLAALAAALAATLGPFDEGPPS